MKLKFDVTVQEFKIIKNILKSALPANCTVWVFGSRAKNQAKFNSDLDLALDYKNKVALKTLLLLLEEAFEESPLPYTVDVLDINDVSENFQTIIRQQAIAFPLAKSDKVPKLRFPEFRGDWERTTLGKESVCLDNKRIPLKEGDRSKRRGAYPYYGASGIIDTIDDYLFDETLVLLAEDGANIIMRNSPISFLAKGKYWVNNHAHVYRANGSPVFLATYLENLRYDKYNTGTAQPKLNGETCKNLKLVFPSLPEQHKIAAFLSAIDTKIAQVAKKKALLEQYKRGCMQKLFSQELRFKDAQGNAFPDWVGKRVSDVLKPKPTKQHQIKSSQFLAHGLFPVVDQGKALIAGYSDDKSKVFSTNGVIVYGDHTTIVKFVNFNFIVGADGTKILKSLGPDIEYLFHSLIFFNVCTEGYKRHFSILKKINLPIPSLPEQQKIAALLSSIDTKVDLITTELEHIKTFKKGLLQQMFV